MEISYVPKNRQDGRYLLILSSMIFVFSAFFLDISMPWAMVDYKAYYYPARCLLQHGDPYNVADVSQIYRAAGSERSADPTVEAAMATVNINPPSNFLLTAPLELLPFGSSQLIWLIMTMGSLLVASALVWNVSGSYAPVTSASLISLVLINSEITVALGNAAGLSIGLCVIAAWCFLKNKLPKVGVFCLALSLLLKPQDGGVLWIFLLLAGTAYRKRALQATITATLLALPIILILKYNAPHWGQEWITNVRALSAQGNMNDPGPSSILWPTPMINLQTVVSLFDNHPLFYNFVTYAFGVPLCLFFASAVLRSKRSRTGAWHALAAIAALILLITYHRRNDSKLLLLAIPACIELWHEGGSKRYLALIVTSAAIFLTGDTEWVFIHELLSRLAIHSPALSVRLEVPLLVFPAPLSLCAAAFFYIWVYRANQKLAFQPEGLAAETID